MYKRFSIAILAIFPIFAGSFFFAFAQDVEALNAASQDTPWVWYISRSSGLIAFALLYISVLFGLSIRMPLLKKIFPPAFSLKAHTIVSVQAIVFALVHAVALTFDKFIKFSFADILIPFYAQYQTVLVGMGTLALYLMVLLVVTSLLRNKISYTLWRSIHFLNILLYVFIFIHALYLGTDFKEPLFRNIFLVANGFLVFLWLINLEMKLASIIKRKFIKTNENLR